MTFDDIDNALADLLNTGDQTFTTAVAHVRSIAEQIKTSELTADEAEELLQDVQRQLDIINEMSHLASKEKLNTIINVLIKMASFI